jgi:hemerythrin-like domain-containing protein
MAAAAGPADAHVAPIQAALLADPIAFLWAEHARQRVLLGHLERIARAPAARGARALAAALLQWLRHELPTHLADEEQSLYPRLAPHDSRGVLARLSAEHERDRYSARDVVQSLASLAEGAAPGAGFTQVALRFAADHRRHLAWEEAEVTPLARRALDEDATAALAEEMLHRRQPELRDA